MDKKNNTWGSALRSTLPVMAGYEVLGIGFGLLMNSKGYGILWTGAMSLFIYAGSMQYLAVDLLFGGASLLTAAITTLLVNARHLFYGISMVDRYRHAGKLKPYLIFGLTDETYSLVCTRDDLDARQCFRITLLNQCWWVTGSLIGAAAGAVIPFNTEGIDFSLTALFLTVVLDQWLNSKDHIPAIIGLAASVICLLIFGPNSFLLPTMGAIVVLLLLNRRLAGKLRRGGEGHA